MTTEPKVNGPCWVELGARDIPRQEDFYGKVFGWDTATDPRPEAGGYTTASLGGRRVAAITPLYGDDQPVAWNVSFRVEDVDAALDAVRGLGGAAVFGPMDVFDEGRFAVAADPAGAVFQLWQAKEFAGAQLMGEPGSLCWVDLHTRDVAAASDFYGRLFGWDLGGGTGYRVLSVGGTPFGGVFDQGSDEGYPKGIPPHWLPSFATADIEGTVAKAAGAGGTTVMPPMRMPGGVTAAALTDPEGAGFGLMQTPGGE
ncbi:VOC family protein [Nocardiopsis sp. RSe5-2]|uniref:VOC family protein n=1 Tax=Nocardiopsis endophytica TaxID=3018445 RepID=A0ABT4U4X7_9ACTN|nr:VOC family protein [Nocardiopsis endophytica]MDA2812003.1 VOC family protein [Nocardiopsis endophytica]